MTDDKRSSEAKPEQPIGFNYQCNACEGKDRCFKTANRWFVVTSDEMHFALCDEHVERERERGILPIEERVQRSDNAKSEPPEDWADGIDAAAGVVRAAMHTSPPGCANAFWQVVITLEKLAENYPGRASRVDYANSELSRARAHVIEAALALDTSGTPKGISTVVTLDRALQRLARAEGREVKS